MNLCFNLNLYRFLYLRYLFVRPLPGKSPYLVANELLDLYHTIGPPAIVQTDQGTERSSPITLAVWTLRSLPNSHPLMLLTKAQGPVRSKEHHANLMP